MRRTDPTVAVDPVPCGDAREFADVLLTFVPGPWTATRLDGAVGRTGNLVRSLAVVGWCGAREVRLLRGRDTGRLTHRLTAVVDLVTAALPPSAVPAVWRHPLTLTNVPDGHRLFDELTAGRKIVVAELAAAGPEAVHRWLRVLAPLADGTGGEESYPTEPDLVEPEARAGRRRAARA